MIASVEQMSVALFAADGVAGLARDLAAELEVLRLALLAERGAEDDQFHIHAWSLARRAELLAGMLEAKGGDAGS